MQVCIPQVADPSLYLRVKLTSNVIEMHLLHLEKLGSFAKSEFVALLESFGVLSILDVLVDLAICKSSLAFSFHCYM